MAQFVFIFSTKIKCEDWKKYDIKNIFNFV